MQAQLDFFYTDNTGAQPRSQFLTADVNCVCPHELGDDEKDSCSTDEGKFWEFSDYISGLKILGSNSKPEYFFKSNKDGNLRFKRTETIHCESGDSAKTVCKDFSIPASDHGCYTVEKPDDTHINVNFDFDVTDEKCLSKTGRRSYGQTGSIETVSTSGRISKWL